MNRDVLFNRLLSLIPNFLSPFKPFLIKKLVKKAGADFRISPSTVILNLSSFECGKNVYINRNFYCSAIKGVYIGDRVMFGANCSIIGGDHSYNDKDDNMRFTKKLGQNNLITIEADAWIGHGTVILKDAYISEGTIIGANSLVTSKTKPYSIYVGQPSKFLHPRFDKFEDLVSYLSFMKREHSFESKYTIDELKKIYEPRSQ